MKIKIAIAIASILATISTPALADGDTVAGKAAFRKCQACHTIDGPNRVGPSLAGIVGRKVASVEGFGYSKAMMGFAEGGKVWDANLLREYLEAPRIIVKGTSMAFSGVKKQDELANLIAYLSDPSAAK